MPAQNETKNEIVTAALVIIGNEILSGRTHDKNIPYVAEKLNDVGVRLVEIRVVPDLQDKIVEAVNILRTRCDYVFTTGGIGPTHDDITAESIAAAFDLPCEKHDEAWATLEGYYVSSGREFTPARQKMAMTPRGASLIPNPVSGAPGFVIENVYVMAGVPHIMQAMLDHAAATLKGGAQMMSETILCNHQESEIAEALSAIQDRYPDIDIGSYPHYANGKFTVNVVLRGTDEALLQGAKRDVKQALS